jgi:KUP system potassium uptake protein
MLLVIFRQRQVIYIVLGILAIIVFSAKIWNCLHWQIVWPIMMVWFGMLAILGIFTLQDDMEIFKAFNPYYALDLLTTYPHGFWILGAFFLCTTGAEALYSDLGHCGRANIRYSWIFRKSLSHRKLSWAGRLVIGQL